MQQWEILPQVKRLNNQKEFLLNSLCFRAELSVFQILSENPLAATKSWPKCMEFHSQSFIKSAILQGTLYKSCVQLQKKMEIVSSPCFDMLSTNSEATTRSCFNQVLYVLCTYKAVFSATSVTLTILFSNHFPVQILFLFTNCLLPLLQHFI